MKGARVRWHIAGRMFVAWLITVPAAGLVGAAFYGIGRAAGSYVVFALLLVFSAATAVHSRRKPVNHKNVNDDWAGDTESVIAQSVEEHDPSLLVLSPAQRKRLKKAAQREKKRAKKQSKKLAKKEKKKRDKKRAKESVGGVGLS